jgi:hypothetical protein
MSLGPGWILWIIDPSDNMDMRFRLLNVRSLYVRWVPVTTAWHILRLQIEEWPPDMEGSCKYIE